MCDSKCAVAVHGWSWDYITFIALDSSFIVFGSIFWWSQDLRNENERHCQHKNVKPLMPIKYPQIKWMEYMLTREEMDNRASNQATSSNFIHTHYAQVFISVAFTDNGQLINWVYVELHCISLVVWINTITLKVGRWQ